MLNPVLVDILHVTGLMRLQHDLQYDVFNQHRTVRFFLIKYLNNDGYSFSKNLLLIFTNRLQTELVLILNILRKVFKKIVFVSQNNGKFRILQLESGIVEFYAKILFEKYNYVISYAIQNRG